MEIVSAALCLLAGLMLYSASGCQETKSAAGWVGGTAAEYIACPVIPGLDCGHVFVCGAVEICVNDDDSDDLAAAEDEFGACEPTPRHQGLCIWCPSDTGCNAMHGCYGCPS